MAKAEEMGGEQIFPGLSGQKKIIFKEWASSLLLLLEVDPYHIYAYWEISPEELSIIINRTKDTFYQSQLVLRVYELSSRKNPGQEIRYFFDTLVEGWKGKRYIEISNPNTSYYAELGLKPLELNEFNVINCSNLIKTPQNLISSSQQEQWMEVVGAYEKINIMEYEHSPAGQTLATRHLDRKLIEKYYADLLSQRKIDLSTQECEQNQAPEQDQTFKQDQAMMQGRALEQDDVADIAVPFPWNIEAGGSQNFSSFSTLSSFAGSYQPQNPQPLGRFWRYGTDLVIYGRVETGVTLYIEGDQVEIQPDGTFSFRLNLDREGDYRIPLRMVFPGGEELVEYIPFHIQKIKGSGE